MHIPAALLQRPALSQLNWSPSAAMIQSPPPADFTRTHTHLQTHTLQTSSVYVSRYDAFDTCCAEHVDQT